MTFKSYTTKKTAAPDGSYEAGQVRHPVTLSRLCKCGRPARHQRTRCNTCRDKMYGHPLLRLYRNLKAHAKERGKVFTLDRDWFVKWIVSNGYAVYHGTYKKRLHIDRIDNSRGYVWGNVRAIECWANCKKGAK